MSEEFSPKIPMQTARVAKMLSESGKVKTIELDTRLVCEPGQFLMVWVPGAGERPISIANNDPLTISVANVGKVSSELHRLKPGSLLSFRGPLGKGFRVQDKWKCILLVGGGYGVAPLYFLAKMATSNNIETLAVVGARTAKDIVYEDKIYLVTAETFVTTDDGSKGAKGNVMVEVERLLADRKRRPDAVFACGPERMMLSVARACLKAEIPCQLSLERYMKCGLGVCGSCDLGGKSVCRDGPVFDALDALAIKEFGESKRDASGKKVGI
jgi:dihydroorotate dehydrogenase electron transfer subunit